MQSLSGAGVLLALTGYRASKLICKGSSHKLLQLKGTHRNETVTQKSPLSMIWIHIIIKRGTNERAARGLPKEAKPATSVYKSSHHLQIKCPRTAAHVILISK
jgi:hypothetical protein